MDLLTVGAMTVLVVSGGYGLWFALAVVNNIVDFHTNRLLIARMMSMQDIKEDPVLGNRLQRRAIEGTTVPSLVYILVVAYQVVVASQFVRVVVALIAALTTGAGLTEALVVQINVVFLMALALWFGFLIGGLWFGYWIKMQQIQTAHILLATLTLFCIGLINQVAPI